MRQLFLTVSLLILALCGNSQAAPATIQAQLNSLSIRVQQGTGSGPFGLQYRGRVTTDEFEINGELAPGPGATHRAFYVMEDPFNEEETWLLIELNLPRTNRNNNAVFDFFEYSQAVSQTVSGRFSVDGQSFSPMTSAWNRAASNALGTVTFNFPAMGLSLTHPFQVIEYRGDYTHTRNGNAITGTNFMTRMDYPEETISGFLNLTISNVNSIVWDESSAGWMDQDRGGLALVPLTGILERSGAEYSDMLAFDDGYFPTSAWDYQLAILTLRDPRDTNGNGIPDFTDSTTGGGGGRPKLTVRLQPTAYILRIDGANGARYDLEFATSLSNPNWARQQTITMTGATTEIAVPRSNSARGYWRLRVL